MLTSATSVHEVPSHCSVSVTVAFGEELLYPVDNMAAVDVPDPPPLRRAVFKSLTSVQVEPFHNSVAATCPVGNEDG